MDDFRLVSFVKETLTWLPASFLQIYLIVSFSHKTLDKAFSLMIPKSIKNEIYNTDRFQNCIIKDVSKNEFKNWNDLLCDRTRKRM